MQPVRAAARVHPEVRTLPHLFSANEFEWRDTGGAQGELVVEKTFLGLGWFQSVSGAGFWGWFLGFAETAGFTRNQRNGTGNETQQHQKRKQQPET
jgi:hypothetical protein